MRKARASRPLRPWRLAVMAFGAGLLALIDLGLIALSVMAWRDATGPPAVGFLVLGVSVAVGVLVYLLVLAAHLAATADLRTSRPLARPRRRATLALTLTVFRLVALPSVTVVLVATTHGRYDDLYVAPTIGLPEIFVSLLYTVVTHQMIRAAIGGAGQ